MAGVGYNIRRRFRDYLVCGVCGDPATGRHFGGLACTSCMTFFRRAVRTGTCRKFICIEEGNNCKMTGFERRKCKSCRFAQCLRAGMEPRWVPDENERQEILRKKMWRRSAGPCGQSASVQRMYNPEPRHPLDCLREEDYEMATSTVVLFRKTAQSLSHQCVEQDFVQLCSDVPNINLLIAMCGGSYMRSIHFAHSFPAFQQLRSLNDKKMLLKRNMSSMTRARVGFAYNPESLKWPTDTAVEAAAPVVDFHDWKPKMSATIWNAYVSLIKKVHLLQMDEACTTLFIIVQLFSSSDVPLEDEKTVEALQTEYLTILRKYVVWRYGSVDANIVFAKILSLLTHLREMREYDNEANFWLENYELAFLSQRLGDFNPYEDYSLERRNNEFLAVTDDPYDLLHCNTPTVEMIRNFMTQAVNIARQYNDEQHDDLQSSLFDLLEENLPLFGHS